MKREKEDRILGAQCDLKIRFCEVDSMSIVWHGSYVKYFEDAREAFGARYGLGYLDIYAQGYYAPLVELSFQYRSPLIYGDKAVVSIDYHFTQAAKIVFGYRINRVSDGRLVAEGRSVQVFMDMDYNMVLYSPDFYRAWQQKMVDEMNRKQ